jgi:hypothetical protein
MATDEQEMIYAECSMMLLSPPIVLRVSKGDERNAILRSFESSCGRLRATSVTAKCQIMNREYGMMSVAC